MLRMLVNFAKPVSAHHLLILPICGVVSFCALAAFNAFMLSSLPALLIGYVATALVFSFVHIELPHRKVIAGSPKVPPPSRKGLKVFPIYSASHAHLFSEGSVSEDGDVKQ